MEVPIPSMVLLLPEFGKMALVKEPVEVAHLVSAKLGVAQALPVPPRRPEVMVRQPSVIPLRVREPRVPEVEKRLVEEAVPEKNAVEVELEVVEFTPVKFCKVLEPFTRRVAKVAAPVLRLEEKRLVDEAVPEKKLVEVEFDEVELRAVKFCSVDEELASMFRKVPNPVEVKLPPEPVVKKRLVLDAVVAKKLVEVAEDEVELRAVKFWRVEEPETSRLASVASDDELITLANKLVEKKFVEVEFEVVELTPVKFWSVDEPLTRRVARVAAPVFKFDENRLVEEAVVAKAEVEVALVVVVLRAWKVRSPLVSILRAE